MSVQYRVLVVDDEASMCELLEIVLSNAGYEVASVGSLEQACSILGKENFDIVVTDLRFGNDKDAGMKLLGWMHEHVPATPAIMITAFASVETAIEAIKLGAADYIMKPFTNDEVRLLVKRAIDQRNLLRENSALRKDQSQRARIDNIIGKSQPIQNVLGMIRRVAMLPSTVAIHGESGTGKELVARAIHSLSDRAPRPFVAINCGGIPENLLESELFGYKRGAFTGAVDEKEGLFVVANGGTLFLDEIGEMPVSLQVKLLRVLDNGRIMPIGGTSEVAVSVRIISATNKNLEEMVAEGKFRKDLYYRLNVIPVFVPPLRERADDIPLLARHFVANHALKMNRNHLQVSPEAMEALSRYHWSGNVRELENVLERSVALCNGNLIELNDLPPEISNYVSAPQKTLSELPEGGLDLENLVSDLEVDLIRQALSKSRYSQKRAAELLGLTPRSFRYRLQKYHLESEV